MVLWRRRRSSLSTGISCLINVFLQSARQWKRTCIIFYKKILIKLMWWFYGYIPFLIKMLYTLYTLPFDSVDRSTQATFVYSSRLISCFLNCDWRWWLPIPNKSLFNVFVGIWSMILILILKIQNTSRFLFSLSLLSF